MGNTVLMRGETVTAFTQELFQKAGMSEPDAKYHAECLVNTNYWGIDSHGVIRVPAYFKRMLNGAINTNPQIKVVRGEGCLEVLDVDAAAGFIGGRAGMERAMDHAAVSGIAACGVINSNHFGAGALYVRMAAERGMIGIAMTNVKPLIVAGSQCSGDRKQSHCLRHSYIRRIPICAGYVSFRGGRRQAYPGNQEEGKDSYGLGN